MTGESDASRTPEDGFCPSCEVTLQLHDTTDGDDEFDCRMASRKAGLLSSFSRLGARPRGDSGATP